MQATHTVCYVRKMQCGVSIHPCRIDLCPAVDEYVEHVDLATPCCEVKWCRPAFIGIIHLAVGINEKRNDVGMAEPSSPMQRSLVPIVSILDADACVIEEERSCQLQYVLKDHGWGHESMLQSERWRAAFRRQACVPKQQPSRMPCEHMKSKHRTGVHTLASYDEKQ